jgi:hypothetical protein
MTVTGMGYTSMLTDALGATIDTFRLELVPGSRPASRLGWAIAGIMQTPYDLGQEDTMIRNYYLGIIRGEMRPGPVPGEPPAAAAQDARLRLNLALEGSGGAVLADNA